MDNSCVTLPVGWEQIPAASLLLKNVKLCDPHRDYAVVETHLFIERGKISAMGDDALKCEACQEFDLNGKMVSPGWFDLHVHLREPGFEYKETILGGLNSAMVGGFTGVACMPNTEPALDHAAIVKWVLDCGKAHPVSLSVIAAATKGRAGKELTELADLSDIGVTAVSDDGSPVSDSGMVRKVMEYGSTFGVKFFSHAEDKSLVGKGVMNESEWSTTLGLPGMPTVAEDVMVARDILLAEYLNCPVHICHISSARSIELVREAQCRGVKVTCEATPHHFTSSMTDACIESFSTDLKMNPPLRSSVDVEAVRAGLKDGTIGTIATDHAPHAPEEKELEFEYAPFGIVGLETAFGLAVRELVKSGVLALPELIWKLTIGPRQALGLAANPVEVGADADLTIFDPDQTWTVDKFKLAGKSRNTPFHGWELTGKAYGIVNKGQYCFLVETNS